MDDLIECLLMKGTTTKIVIQPRVYSVPTSHILSDHRPNTHAHVDHRQARQTINVSSITIPPLLPYTAVTIVLHFLKNFFFYCMLGMTSFEKKVS